MIYPICRKPHSNTIDRCGSSELMRMQPRENFPPHFRVSTKNTNKSPYTATTFCIYKTKDQLMQYHLFPLHP